VSLFAKNYTSIINESLDYMTKNTAINVKTPGGKFRVLLDIFANSLSSAYSVFDSNMLKSYVYGASDEYLDYIGSIFGITRYPSQMSSVDSASQIIKYYVKSGTFGDINSGQNIVVKQNTKIWANSGSTKILYNIPSETILYATSSESFISAHALDIDGSYNVPANSIRFFETVEYTEKIRGTLLLTNVDAPISRCVK